jgi:hypothetical protein
MDTKPTLIRPEAGAGAVATALAEPSITVIEAGPALGVLVADGCHEATAAGCSWTGLPGPAATRPSEHFATSGACAFPGPTTASRSPRRLGRAGCSPG